MLRTVDDAVAFWSSESIRMVGDLVKREYNRRIRLRESFLSPPGLAIAAADSSTSCIETRREGDEAAAGLRLRTR